MAKEMQNEFLGAEATLKANSMTKTYVDTEKWEKIFTDEETGERWLMDFPYPEAHGGGPPRLRKIPQGTE